MTESQAADKSLQQLDGSAPLRFEKPTKKINDGEDVSFFLASKAYADIMTWLLQLNASMFPQKTSSSYQAFGLESSDAELSPTVQKLQQLLQKLGSIVDEAPPDTGPRRFGNISFRKWYDIVEARMPGLLEESLPSHLLTLGAAEDGAISAREELQAYLLGSFGSSQRLDYGTGHELSFLAFLGCIWKLGGFAKADPGVEERAIVRGVIEPYLQLIRRLILTYTLEPAGSHGVWGLDDHSFIPYIFGSAQLSPPIRSPAEIPPEGSLPDAPDPGDVARATAVERERKKNMYFSAIGFIYDVKKGPFWEHSPILFDISGVRAGWAKINKGMLKMYNAEVLSKFPVVQHFPFGSLFRWEKDPTAAEVPRSIHTTSQPPRAGQPSEAALRNPLQDGSTRMPRAVNAGTLPTMTAAPWAARSNTRDPATGLPSGVPGATRMPPPPSSSTGTSAPPNGGPRMPPSTQAPWARKNAH
ncbi:phosphotyrosyl phosphatase activator [Saccharata proteae CBS 121410]|uniref:Serine/threonine-protein phosphatase 2A activator n=1 Tax=Saccharata proteae CBS 121410 TaxID=1314787 RepID=A0A9P4M3A8_9PEZI|nr:phosphotyrosyl phosphatase activator [Saccharata proteae CBS 121410]